MNERIKELALKAGMKHPVMGEISYANFSYEEFAELIVEDCIRNLIKYAEVYDIRNKTMNLVCYALKQHFGAN